MVQMKLNLCVCIFVKQHADPWEQDGRHVKPEIIQEIMGQFIEKAVTKSD